MTVMIGHASIDENGAASGGSAGNQTGRELCTRAWYARDWNVLLRPATDALAERSAQACAAACANAYIGYDQSGRNTLYQRAKEADFDLAAIDTPCECDCSSLMHVCAVAGGADIPFEGNCCTTRTMVRAFTGSGDYIRLTGREFLTTDAHLRRGDILVKEGSHTVMVLGSGEAAPAVCTLALPVLRPGAAGEPVRAMQRLLGAQETDARFGGGVETALRRYQQAMNLEPDGICGRDTWSALLGLTGVG